MWCLRGFYECCQGRAGCPSCMFPHGGVNFLIVLTPEGFWLVVRWSWFWWKTAVDWVQGLQLWQLSGRTPLSYAARDWLSAWIGLSTLRVIGFPHGLDCQRCCVCLAFRMDWTVDAAACVWLSAWIGLSTLRVIGFPHGLGCQRCMWLAVHMGWSIWGWCILNVLTLCRCSGTSVVLTADDSQF